MKREIKVAGGAEILLLQLRYQDPEFDQDVVLLRFHGYGSSEGILVVT